jgi:hypothetical protein
MDADALAVLSGQRSSCRTQTDPTCSPLGVETAAYATPGEALVNKRTGNEVFASDVAVS